LIYFTSSAGIRGGAGQPNYSAAHAGKIGLMLSCANALGRYGVTANAISPGAATRMTDRGRNIDSPDAVRSDNATGTRMDPRNVVPPIVFLASDRGAKITGRVIGATGHRITMWREPQWEASLYYEKPAWDIDELFQVMPTTLGAGGWPPTPPNFP
jgi:NAD(P)-dependent dehydrogenase (short-subunit alcohol dehydrogenase family)